MFLTVLQMWPPPFFNTLASPFKISRRGPGLTVVAVSGAEFGSNRHVYTHFHMYDVGWGACMSKMWPWTQLNSTETCLCRGLYLRSSDDRPSSVSRRRGERESLKGLQISRCRCRCVRFHRKWRRRSSDWMNETDKSFNFMWFWRGAGRDMLSPLTVMLTGPDRLFLRGESAATEVSPTEERCSAPVQ